MSADNDVLTRIWGHFREAIDARDHMHHRLETIMQYLPEFIDRHKAVLKERDSLQADLASEKARAEAAEAERDQLKGQVAQDESAVKAALDADPAPQPAGQTADQPSPATPVVTTTATGATVTVDASVATHVDPSSGITTTVPHDGSAPSATNAAGVPVTPDPSAVADAQGAAQAAGVAAAS